MFAFIVLITLCIHCLAIAWSRLRVSLLRVWRRTVSVDHQTKLTSDDRRRQYIVELWVSKLSVNPLWLHHLSPVSPLGMEHCSCGGLRIAYSVLLVFNQGSSLNESTRSMKIKWVLVSVNVKRWRHWLRRICPTLHIYHCDRPWSPTIKLTSQWHLHS